MPFRARVPPLAGMTAESLVAAAGDSAGERPADGASAWSPGEFACVRDAEGLARAALPPNVWDFVSGGSGAELTRRANRYAFDRVAIVPRIMADVSSCGTRAELIGIAANLPVAVAPMAYQRMVHPDGELGLAAACAAAGVPYTAAMLSSTRLEEIAALGGCAWFQLYWLRDKCLLADLIDRAQAAGCRALMLTADVPELGRRLRDLRNGFSLPDGIVAANLEGDATASRATEAGSSAVASHTAAAFDPSLSWRDLDWLRGQTSLPIVLKGVLDPGDALRAAEAGVAGIVVSNHGGRQLDGAVPSLQALPPVVDAVAGRCQVLLDSGIRSGTDVLKAVALGAGGVLLGRPALWGLAAGGEQGVQRVLSLLGEELRHAMKLAGCRDLARAGRLRTVASPAAAHAAAQP